jgi:hypothetical protein
MVEILETKAIVHQYPPNKETGEQQPPACYVLVTFQQLDRDGEPEGEPVDQYYKFAKTSQCLPMNEDGDGPTEDEVGAEGTAFWAFEDSWKINEKTAWSVFVKEAEKRGFKSEVLRGGALDVFEGTVGEIMNLTSKGNIDGKDTSWSVPVFKTITGFPYEKKGGKKSKAKPAAVKSEEGGSKLASKVTNGANVEAVAQQLLMQVVKEVEGSAPITSIRRDMLAAAMDKDDMSTAEQRAVSAMVDDGDFMAECGKLLGFEVKAKKLVMVEE